MIPVQLAATFACFALGVLSGCAIAQGEPIGSSRLVVTPDAAGHAALSAPKCPDWQRDSREDFSNRTGSNFGCADAVNFLGQLADPADAIAGRTTGREDGAAAAGGVERYRTHKTTPLATGAGGAAGAASSGAGSSGNPS